MKREVSKKRKGFTLIELVIVIVIIGVLAGIAALSYTNVTQSSKDGVAKSNLRALKSAVMVYQADNGGQLPAQQTTVYTGDYAPAFDAKVDSKAENLGNLQKYLDNNSYRKPGPGYTYGLTAKTKNLGGTTVVEEVVLTVKGGGLPAAPKEGETQYTIKAK